MPLIWDHSLDLALREALRPLSGSVLDLGCGTKPHRHLMGERARCWLGADHPATRADRNNAQDVSADAERLPFRDGSFDVVICTQVLEHVPHPHLLFAEAARVLAPGGHLVLSAPQQVDSLHEEPYDFFRYTKYGLATLATDAGLVVEKTLQLGASARLFGELALRHGGPLRRVVHERSFARGIAFVDDQLARFSEGARRAAMGWVIVAVRRS